MYESITYEGLLAGMLQRVRAGYPDLDTREGSLLWYALAPAAVELQNLYIQLDTVLNETFGDTAGRPYLILRAAERGISPYPATAAVYKGEFTPKELEIPMGARFSLGTLHFTVVEKSAAGEYRLECDTAGEAGNGQAGELTPVEYLPGLGTARLAELLIPGEDEENTESLRQRYLASFASQAFGGNAADYREKVLALPGVGGVKICKAWNGGIAPSAFVPPAGFDGWYTGASGSLPEDVRAWLDAVSAAGKEGQLTVGGAVRLVIQDATFGAPSEELVGQVQEAIDPEQNHGEGVGLAPIGHVVTVRGAMETAVDIQTTLSYEEGWAFEDVKPYAEAILDGYFRELAEGWADADGITVRISQIETRLLSCPGVVDIAGTAINGQPQNLSLGPDEIPIRGALDG